MGSDDPNMMFVWIGVVVVLGLILACRGRSESEDQESGEVGVVQQPVVRQQAETLWARRVVSLVVIFGILILAVLTNPAPEDFQNYVLDYIRRESAGNPNLAQWLTLLVAEEYFRRTTRRSNYTVFSVYTLVGVDTRGRLISQRFLGLFGQFIPLPGS